MQRSLSLLSSVAVLTAAAVAQCPQGTTAGLVKWSSGSGYAATNPLDDESITSPPIALGGTFFMPGSPGNLDTMWVNCNGEVYFTDSTLGLLQPATGASFGINTIAEMRGAAVGASARVAVLGGDHQGSIAAGASWNVSVDQSVPGEITVTWFDIRRFNNATGDRFSFRGRFILATGVVECSYGPTFPVTGFTGRYVGISIGNNVGTATQVNSDLSAGPNSGVDGILYQNFTGTAPNVWDLSGQTVTFAPNGTNGYTAAVAAYAPPTCAFTANYGTGCYNIPGNNSFHQVFVDSPTAKTALDGNSMTIARSGTTYTTTWNGTGGPAFVAPGGGATTLVFADDDDGDVAYAPAFGAIPTPTGPAATINVAVNGILTMAATANNVFDFTPAAADITSNTAAPNTAIYGYWRDMLLSDTAPAVNGTITAEEVGNMLYVSWNAVECYATALANPSTFQYQVNMVTGDVTVVWVSLDNSANTSDTAVGVSLAGAGTTPGALTLATGLPVTLATNINPLTLGATGRPVITLGGTGPSQNITLTGTNVPELVPGLATGLLFFGVVQIPAGIDLGPLGVDVGMPGCNLYTTLDVVLPFSGTPGTQVLFNAAIPQPLSPGLNFYAQALALIVPNSLPGPLNSFGGVMSNGVQLHFENQ